MMQVNKVLVLALMMLASGQASTVYVSDSQGSDIDGTGSAAQPYKTITAAMGALADIGAENITLLPGRYTGALNTGLRVAITSNTVRIVSEKGPLETFLGSPEDYRAFQVGGAARNGSTTVTLPYVPINGTDDASTSAVRDDSWRGRVPNLVLSGITIVGGKATKGAGVYVEGGILKMLNCRVVQSGHGGVYIKGPASKVLIANSIIAHNGAKSSDITPTPQLKSGGAVFLEDGSLHCDACSFANNTAIEHGGAIYVVRGSLRLSNTNFTENRALQGGGGAVFIANSTIGSYIVLSKFRNNSAVRGGALFVGADSTPQFINCSFTWNQASHIGGAVLLGDRTRAGFKRASFVQNTAMKAGGAVAVLGQPVAALGFTMFTGNRADIGGAVYAVGRSRLTISDGVMIENIANNGAAVFVGDIARPVIQRCDISANRASRGGALYADDSCRPKFSQCKVKNNFASMDGGAIFAAFDSSPDFEECAFTDNSSNLGDPFHMSPGAQKQIRFVMCSVYPHPKSMQDGLRDDSGFPEVLHVW